MRLLAIFLLLLMAGPSFAATCVVTEHSLLPRDRNGQIAQIPTFPPVTIQTVTYTTSTATGNAFGDSTRYIGIICDAKAHFEVAAEGAAAAVVTDPWLPADTWLFINVPGGAEIAFYDGSS